MPSPRPADRSGLLESAFKPNADASWIWTLAQREPGQVAQRLAEHDSIHLQAGTALRLRERFQILDSERVFRKACVLVALGAAETSGDPPPEESMRAWFEERIDDAVRDCLDADEMAQRDGLPCAEDLAHYEFFTKTCFVIPENSLFVSLNFNRLPEDCRRSFFALFIDHCSVAEALEMGLGPEDRLRDNARRALDAAAGIDPRAPSWRDVQDDTIGPWWAQEDAFDGAP
ncbi:hypothetical protein [Engelhardtia mirabilis]|uniref:Uncharacterized protein n=1 Tax=Engelhardtia mirabilis TaxID=2528011 RepID=A0A518BE63_9BACT|nr:hypothetical protein Pla133_03340 [Planctomycetes bacterium Pla133]QDU99596.1 hypothetical protein Pla86_03340 [Planctomycetes bacterium Pla86]